jgi:hypothetical protein
MGGGACFFFIVTMGLYALLMLTTGIEYSNDVAIILALISIMIYTKEE